MGSYKQIKKPTFQPFQVSQISSLQRKHNLGLPQPKPKGLTLEEMEISRKNAERLGDYIFDFSSTPPPGVQAKLNVGEVGDKYEQEADSVAGQVVEEINSPQGQVEPNVMRQCDACEGEKEESSTSLQRQGEIGEGKVSEGLLHHNERVGQDGFVYQGDYAQGLTPMVQQPSKQVQQKPANSKNSKQSDVAPHPGGGGVLMIFYFFGVLFSISPAGMILDRVLSSSPKDKIPRVNAISRSTAFECSPKPPDPKAIKTFNDLVSLLRAGKSDAILNLMRGLSQVDGGQDGLRKLHDILGFFTTCTTIDDKLRADADTLLNMIGPFIGR